MIPALRVGHATDAVGLTGCTPILPDRPAVGAVEVLGRAAGVYGIEFHDTRHLAPTTHGVVLAGGSAFGLAPAWGVRRYLAARGGGGAAGAERGGVPVGALMVVNAVGDVRAPETGQLIAGARDAPDGRRLIDTAATLRAGAPRPAFRPMHTTIGVVATTALLTKEEAQRVARLGAQGFERALSPPHLDTDGDTLFCLSGGGG